jgi:hypothetical protein
MILIEIQILLGDSLSECVQLETQPINNINPLRLEGKYSESEKFTAITLVANHSDLAREKV